MGLSSKSNTITVAVLLTVTAFSCSLPIFSRSVAPNPNLSAHDQSNQLHPAKLSGVLDLNGDCVPGYYQVKLQGIFETVNIQVESQTDQTGHFSLTAPPGKYIMSVSKDGCGSKQTVELEENTEHMYSVVVFDTNSVDREGQKGGRLPASVLIEPKVNH